jgi:hypothetical protein
MKKKHTLKKKYHKNKSKKLRGGVAPALLLIENIPKIANYSFATIDTFMKWLNTANKAINTYDKIKQPPGSADKDNSEKDTKKPEPEVKPEVTPEVKPEVKPEVTPEVKPVSPVPVTMKPSVPVTKKPSVPVTKKPSVPVIQKK